MTFRELYCYKLYEYMNYNVREKLDKLLAILLLSDVHFYEKDKVSIKDFYRRNKTNIDKRISQIEKDYSITDKDYTAYYIENDKAMDIYDIKNSKVWIVYKAGIEALYISVMTDKKPIDTYKELFDSADFDKDYDIEKLALACDIDVTDLDDVLSNVVNNLDEFYKKIGDSLTPDERNFIINHLEGRNCFNCHNPECRVEFNEKIGTDENGNRQGYRCNGWDNKTIIGKAKVLKLTNIDKLNYSIY